MTLEQNLFYLFILETQQPIIEKQQLNSLRLQITGSINSDNKGDLIKLLKNRIAEVYRENEIRFLQPIKFKTDDKISDVINPNLKNKSLTFHFSKTDNELIINDILQDNTNLIFEPIKILL